MRLLRWVIGISIALQPFSGWSQSSRFFTNLSKSSGLSSNSITSITQDQKGFIWVGTKNGLNRYDGKAYIHFHTGNSSLSSNDISDLKVDDNGHLWVGLRGGGTAKFNPATNDFNYPKPTINKPNLTVYSIYVNDPGRLWVLSDNGPFDLNNNRRHIKLPTGIQMTSMINHGDYLWFGTDDGQVLKVNEAGVIAEFPISQKSRGSVNRIWAMHSISDTELLIGSQNNGLLIFNTSKESFSEFRDIEAQIVRSLITDHNGHLWIGTDGHGIYEIDEVGQLHNFRHIYGNANSLASNAVTSIFEDSSGNIWFGTPWDGLSILQDHPTDSRFYYSDFKGTQSTGVLSIYSEKDHLLFGSDGNGVHIWPSEDVGWTKIRNRIGTNTYVQFINRLSDDHYWIGTFKQGLFRFELSTGKFKNYKFQANDPSSISYNDIRDIEYLEGTEYLIATWGGGLNIFDTRGQTFSLILFDENQNLPKNIVTLSRISEDKILVGTFGEGLFIYDTRGKKLRRIFYDQLGNCISILSLKNHIWIGTWGEGLFQLDHQLKNLTKVPDSIVSPYETVLSILPDNDNGVVFSTKSSVFHLDRTMKIIEVPGSKGQYHINSGFKDQNGRFYLGNTEGVISFENYGHKENFERDVKLLNVKVFDQRIDPTFFDSEGIKLEYDENVLTFDFAALDYPSSSEIRYQVKVDPIHKDWINMGEQRSITLANLKPNSYTIHIKTEESSIITSLPFLIDKPWWLSWWALGLYVLLFLLLLYLFRVYAVRLEKLRARLSIEKLNREKELEIGRIKQKFFVNISHEIRTPLTLIMGEIERLMPNTSASSKIARSIVNIRSNSNYIMQLVNELLDFRKLESEELKLHVAEGDIVKFTKEIFLAFQNMAEIKRIQYEFETSHESIMIWYDRDQLEKVFFNLLSNAFKYTESNNSISFQIILEKDAVIVEVRDTGKGIPRNQLQNVFKRFYQSDNAIHHAETGFGIGLSIVQDIVQLHHGNVSVESAPGEGTRFLVKLPRGKDAFSSDQVLTNFLDSESIQLYERTLKDHPVFIENEYKSDEKELLLIVEDNEDIRNFIQEELSADYRTIIAENGLRALDLLEQEPPDLIISDIMMPEMDGIALLKKIKQDKSTCHIPVILLTARTGLIYKKEGYTTGADDFITKPFNSSILQTRIRNIFENRQRLREKIRTEFLTKPKELDLMNPDEQFLVDLTEIIDRNLNNESLDTHLISTELGMSHSVVYKKLKALTGFSIVEFVRDYRLSQAAKMLTTYGFSIAETSYKVGFSDKKYFSQMFKRKFNMTPSEYLKSSPERS